MRSPVSSALNSLDFMVSAPASEAVVIGKGLEVTDALGCGYAAGGIDINKLVRGQEATILARGESSRKAWYDGEGGDRCV